MWVEWDWDHISCRASVDWGSILGSVLRVLACIVDFEQIKTFLKHLIDYHSIFCVENSLWGRKAELGKLGKKLFDRSDKGGWLGLE